MQSKLILILIIIFSSIGIASADTHYVEGTDQKSIKETFDNAHSGDTVVFREGDYYITHSIITYGKFLIVIGEGEVKIHSTAGADPCLIFSGSAVLKTVSSKSAEEGSTTVEISDASKVKAGDLIKIWKNVKWCPKDYPKQLTGEVYKIESVSGDTLTLNEPLLRNYPAGANIEIYRPVQVTVDNLQILNTDSKGKVEGIRFQYCTDSKISNCVFRDNGRAAIRIQCCWETTIEDNKIYDSTRPGNGYGISVYDGSAYIIVINNYIKNCRHCIMSGASLDFNSLNRDITISKNVLIGGKVSDSFVLDSHEMTIDYEVTDNEFYVVDNWAAFQDGTYTSVFTDNVIYVEAGRSSFYSGGEYRKRGHVDGGTHTRKNTFKTWDGKPISSPAQEDNPDVITVDGFSDDAINNALKKAEDTGCKKVYLPAGVYLVNSPIIIPCSGVTLYGDPDAIIRVDPDSDQWFRGLTGIINSKGNDDITIEGFQIDGNCDELNPSMADSSSATSHDCERAIVIAGSSQDFVKGIAIKNMEIYDCFSDGVHVRFAENVIVSDCELSNCQHEGIYFVCVREGAMKNNKIAGVTSDCARLDNCEYCKISGNTFFSYTGDHNNGAALNGQNGLQISDQGFSKGGGSDKSDIIHTNNIEVANNKFVNGGQKSIWLDSAQKGLGENIYIHDNEFVGVEEIETEGVSIEDLIEDVEDGRMPTKTESDDVFDSIFDIFELGVYTTVDDDETVILPEGMEESEGKAICKIEYQKIGNDTSTIVKISDEYLNGVSEIIYAVNGVETTHTILLGEKTSDGIVFSKTSMWNGELEHTGDALKLDGRVDPKYIDVTCVTPNHSFVPVYEITEFEFKPFVINPGIFILLTIVLFGVIVIRFILRHRA